MSAKGLPKDPKRPYSPKVPQGITFFNIQRMPPPTQNTVKQGDKWYLAEPQANKDT